MSLMPVLCPACRRVQLPLAALRGGQELPPCRICGHETRVVPGCSFGLKDRELYEDVSEVIAQAGVATSEAEVLALETQRALWSGAYAKLLERLGTRLPALLPLQLAVGANADGQRKLLVVVRSVLEALATLRTSPARP